MCLFYIQRRSKLTDLIAVVHQDEEEVEAAHDGGGQVDVLLQALAAVVAPSDWVGGSQDGCASVQGGLKKTEATTGYATAETRFLHPSNLSTFQAFPVAYSSVKECMTEYCRLKGAPSTGL